MGRLTNASAAIRVKPLQTGNEVRDRATRSVLPLLSRASSVLRTRSIELTLHRRILEQRLAQDSWNVAVYIRVCRGLPSRAFLTLTGLVTQVAEEPNNPCVKIPLKPKAWSQQC